MKTKFQQSKTFVRELNKASNRGLLKLGGFVRVSARRSIRKHRGYSKPGDPPYSHKGNLKKGIRFEVEKATFGIRVLIGVNKEMKGQTAHILEYGGRARSISGLEE